MALCQLFDDDSLQIFRYWESLYTVFHNECTSYISINSGLEYHFPLYSHQHLCFFFIFLFSDDSHSNWSVVFIVISLMANVPDHVFWPFEFERCLFVSFVRFFIGIFVFLLSFLNSFWILEINHPSILQFANILSHFCWLPFHIVHSLFCDLFSSYNHICLIFIWLPMLLDSSKISLPMTMSYRVFLIVPLVIWCY